MDLSDIQNKVSDPYERVCIAIEVERLLSGHRVCRVVDHIVTDRGHPNRILTDCVSKLKATCWIAVPTNSGWNITPFSRGKPVRNPFVESLNGTMRNEYRIDHWFLDLEYSKDIIEACWIDYHTKRLHSSFGGKTTGKFASIVQNLLRPPIHLGDGAKENPPRTPSQLQFDKLSQRLFL